MIKKKSHLKKEKAVAEQKQDEVKPVAIHESRDYSSRQSGCIVCKKFVSGRPVNEDDYGIVIMRMIKSRFMEVGKYSLVVCDSCVPKYLETRKRFVSNRNMFSLFIGIMVIMAVILPVVSMRLPDVYLVIMFLVLSLMLMVLAHLVYLPPLKNEN